jgi:N-methylhydantoinase A/oxoprolinase/acetone carboxylase beta subunit
VLKAARDIQAEGIENIAVIGTYAPTDLVHRQEETVKDLLRSALGDKVNITLSHQVAGIGFLERENASILNAAILPSARRTIRQFQKAAQKLAIAAPLYAQLAGFGINWADD